MLKKSQVTDIKPACPVKMKINILQQEKEKMDNNERKKDDSAISNDDMVGKDNFDH